MIKKKLCPVCNSEDIISRELETLSVKAEPIIVEEHTCRNCNKKWEEPKE